jgi:hypothetical protein
MSDTTAQQALWASPSYRELDEKRRRLASKVILEGLSFSQACRQLNLNQTRERSNFDLQLCLAEHGPASPVPADHPAVQQFDTPRGEVMAAWYALVDHLEAKGSWDGWGGVKGVSDEAVHAAELVNIENGSSMKHCPKASILDPQRVAEFVVECRRGVDEIFARLDAIKARKAELAARTVCDGCKGPLTEPRSIAGIHVYCGPCGYIWSKTGTVPKTS